MLDDPVADRLDEGFLMRRLPWSLAHNALNTAFYGLVVSGPVFLLFTTTLGFDQAQIGLLLSLLPFAYLISPVIAGPLARRGYRRSYLLFWSARYVIISGMLIVPWLAGRFGLPVALAFATAVIAGFALCRAIGDTAFLPWLQEFVPERVLGKYFAANGIITSLANFLVLALASAILRVSTGINTFLAIIAGGIVLGVLSIVAAVYIPGGAGAAAGAQRLQSRRGQAAALHDPNFISYLAGYSLIMLGTAPLFAFLPLIAQDRMGLSASTVVLLQSAALLGGLVASFGWGRMADRRGGRTVSILLAPAYALNAALWLLAPQGGQGIEYLALLLASITGGVAAGWQIASTRFLFAGIMPPNRKSAYSALFLTWTGIVGGIGPLLAGRLLSYEALVMPGPARFALDAQSVLLGLGILLPLLGMLALRQTRPDTPPAGQSSPAET